MKQVTLLLAALVLCALASGCGGDPPGGARALSGPIVGAGGAAGGNGVAAGGQGGLAEGGSGGLAEGGSGGLAEGGSGGLAEGGSGGMAEGGSGGIMAEGGSGGMAEGGSGGSTTGGGLPPGDWAPTGGPPGILVDRLFAASSGTLFSSSSGGIDSIPSFARSTDGGVTWSWQSGPVPGSRGITEVNGILFTNHYDAPNNTISLHASIDDGITWTEKVAGWGNMVGPVAGPNGLLWALRSYDGELRTSADGGTTWTVAGAAPVTHGHAFKFFGEGGRLYLDDGTLVASQDGVTWSTLTHPGVDFDSIQQLVAFGGSLYVDLLRGKNMRSDDGGLTWQVDSIDSGECPYYRLGSSLYTVKSSHVYEHGASGWTLAGAMVPTCPRAAGGGTLWLQVANQDGEVVRWDPGTMYPTRATILSPHAPMASLSGNDDLLLGTDRSGTVFRSVDGGTTWERLAQRNYGRLTPLGGPNWLVETGVSWDPDGRARPASGIALSTDVGATWWSAAPMGGANFVVAGADILAAGPGGLHRSTNGGFIWSSVQATMPGNFQELWRVGSTIFAAGVDNQSAPAWPARTWRSTDDGVTFSEVAHARFSGGVVRVGSQLVALGSTGEPDYIADIWHSHDDGVTWQQMNAALPSQALGTLVSNGTDLFVLELGWFSQPRQPFVWHSADAGMTWAPLGSDLPGLVTGIVATSSGLFVSVEGAGIWKWSPTP